MNNFKEVLTDSYCRAIRKHFENNTEEEIGYFSVEKQEFELYRQLDRYQNAKERLMTEWANSPIEELNGATPSGLINGMADFKDVLDLFLYMVENADDEVPVIIIEKLKSFRDEAVSTLAGLAGSCLENRGNDIVFIAAVSALGSFKLRGAVQSLINLAYKVNDKGSELDHIEEALKNAGTCAIDPVLEALEGKEMGTVEKMLLYVLASVGSKCKDDRIYQKLRLAFRTMDDKMPAVICLSVYGDGRAIPMLRGYLERTGRIEKNLFYEIIGTIKNLGGSTEEFLKFH